MSPTREFRLPLKDAGPPIGNWPAHLSSSPTSRPKVLAYLAAILVLASFLRLYRLTSLPPGLYPDEAVNGNNAAEAAQTGQFKVFYPENYGREGLYINLAALEFSWFHFPHEPWVVRLPAAIAGILTVLGIYFLAAELLGADAGLLSAFFLSTSFWHINFSRVGFRAILSPLCLVWALFFFLAALRSGTRKSAVTGAIASGLIYAAGFYTYIPYRITPLLFFLFIPFFKKRASFGLVVGLFLTTTFIVGLPIGSYFLRHPADFYGRVAALSVASSPSPVINLLKNLAKTAAMFNLRGDWNWRHNISGAPELWWPVGILFLIGISYGMYFALFKFDARGKVPTAETTKEDSRFVLPFLILFGWLVLSLIPVVMSNQGVPHAMRSILAAPPAVVFGAIGGVLTYRTLLKLGHRRLVKALAVAFLALTALFAYADYFVVWAPSPHVARAFRAGYVAIGRQINALPASTPKYVIVRATGDMVRGVPMPAETIMFITDTFPQRGREAKNVHYLLPNEASKIPPGSEIFWIR